MPIVNQIRDQWRSLAHEYAPFISVSVIIVSLFCVVFCKMEIRRMGYLVLKLTRAEQKLRDQERERTMVLAKATRPEHLQAIAQSRLTLRKAAAGQIIQMTNHGIALRE